MIIPYSIHVTTGFHNACDCFRVIGLNCLLQRELWIIPSTTAARGEREEAESSCRRQHGLASREGHGGLPCFIVKGPREGTP